MASPSAFHPLEHDVMHKTFRIALLRVVFAAAFAALATTAQAGWVSGNFDPPDLSGTFTFELNGSSCFATDGPKSVNNGDINDCQVSLTRLTVTLDHSQALDTSAIVFPDFADITQIDIAGGQLAGVDSNLIGPLTGPPGIYAGPWWIQYFFENFVFENFDPVNLYGCPTDTPNCSKDTSSIVDTASTVTFFTSDANGDPIPEPGSLLLIVAALGAGWLARRRAAA
jgi:hypothetical protein